MIYQTNFTVNDFMGKQKEIGWTKDNIKIQPKKKPIYDEVMQRRSDEIIRERIRAMDDHEKAVVYEELSRTMSPIIHYR